MNSTPDPPSDLILASASPRRAAYLTQLGVRFCVQPAHVDESLQDREAVGDYVRRVALHKAEAVSSTGAQRIPVLAADTAVVIDDQILGKPRNLEDAHAMLGLLSGHWHEVHTGVALMRQTSSVIAVRTRVKFRSIDSGEIETYWATGEPADKAGAYAIQGLGAAFVERIEGSYSNVVGLPLVETLSLFKKYGIPHALSAQPF